MPTAKSPMAAGAARIVDAPPVWVLVGDAWESEPEPEAEAVNGLDCFVGLTVGYGPETRIQLLIVGVGEGVLTWALTAFGLDLKGLAVGVILPPGQNGNAERSRDTYICAVEDVGEVDNIACAGVEVGDEVYVALVIVFCRETISEPGHEFRMILHVRMATSGVGAVRSVVFGLVTLDIDTQVNKKEKAGEAQ
jgi:hypothetical protein